MGVGVGYGALTAGSVGLETSAAVASGTSAVGVNSNKLVEGAERVMAAVEAAVINGPTNREMLGQAIQAVKNFSGTAAERTEVFVGLAQRIAKLSGNTFGWSSSVGLDGSRVFAGDFGYTFVISPQNLLCLGILTYWGISI
jgi:hypothetical protein